MVGGVGALRLRIGVAATAAGTSDDPIGWLDIEAAAVEELDIAVLGKKPTRMLRTVHTRDPAIIHRRQSASAVSIIVSGSPCTRFDRGVR
jgi:hypothetical protein